METDAILVYVTIATVACFVLGVPIILCMGVWVACTLYFTGIFPLDNIGLSAFFGLKYFALLAMPLFILTGDLISAGGIAKRLIRFASVSLKRLPGKLGVSTIAACGMFSAISGSNSATTAAIGRIVIPEMTARRYPVALSAAVCAAGGTVGVIIPPSLIFILYGVLMSVSPSDLFIAGIVPGMLMLIAMVTVTVIISLMSKTPWDQGDTTDEDGSVIRAAWEAKTGFLAIFIGLGGIYAGVFSPTEAAGVVVMYCLVAGLFFTRELRFRQLHRIVFSSSSIAGLIAPIVAIAIMVQETVTVLGLQQAVEQFIGGMTQTDTQVIVLAMGIVFLAGCVLESVPVVIIFAPILAPIATAAGLDPVHFAVIFVLGSTIGFITPPYGLNLYMASGVSGAGVLEISLRILPYVLSLVVVWIIVAAFPGLSMFLLDLL